MADELSPQEQRRARKMAQECSDKMEAVMNDPRKRVQVGQMVRAFQRETNKLAIWDVVDSAIGVAFYQQLLSHFCKKDHKPDEFWANAVPENQPPDWINPQLASVLTIGLMAGIFMTEQGLSKLILREARP